MEEIINKQGFCIIDGGFSTQCEAEGANINDELWSSKLIYENPELIEKVHYQFLEAGADVIITSTY
jgi:homocysteine S-methyltransferase